MPDAHRDEIAKLEALYAENPEGRIFTHLAEAYRKAGELERAHEVLEEGIARHPDYSSAHVVLGRVLVDRDRDEEAEAEFRRVLELDPHNMIAIRSLADLARTRGDDGEALEYYHRLLEVEPSDEEARAIVEELTTGVPASGESVGETGEAGEAAPASDETSWGAEPGWGESSEDPFADDGFAADAVPGDEEGPEVEDESEPEPSPWSGQELAGPEAEASRDEGEAGEEGAWATTEPEPSEGDGEWIGGTQLPERDDGIEVDSEPGDWGSVEELREEDTEVRTETIAQVYARQGLYDRAAEVYRELVRTRPDDDRLRERLAEMEQLAARTGEDETRAVEGFSPDPGSAPFGGQVGAGDRGEIESEEELAEPEPYAVEGLQTADFDAADVEAASLAGLEVDETDPVTGLRSDTVAGDTDPAPGEVAEAMEAGGAYEADEAEEPFELEGDGGADVVDAEEESDASIWTEGDWGGDDAGMTPHAWTDEEPEEDTSSPIRSYFSGLLDWSDGEGGETRDGAPGDEVPPQSQDRPADDGTVGGAEPGTPADPAGGSGDDDDLDMFRSWLESLKQ